MTYKTMSTHCCSMYLNITYIKHCLRVDATVKSVGCVHALNVSCLSVVCIFFAQICCEVEYKDWVR